MKKNDIGCIEDYFEYSGFADVAIPEYEQDNSGYVEYED